MENIYLDKTLRTPAVEFNFEKNYLEISGISIPENADRFYAYLLDWVEDYVALKQDVQTTVTLKLFCYNSTSAAYLVSMLKRLKVLDKKSVANGSPASPEHLIIHWYYEEGDEDMQEEGKLIESMVNIPFAFHACEEISYRPKMMIWLFDIFCLEETGHTYASLRLRPYIYECRRPSSTRLL
ncbi:MAG: DUF1987 domain-containing protein [Bacteroidia bacterium]|nr:DUF1987 domain-containing protein [Bacteroidia bacterium]